MAAVLSCTPKGVPSSLPPSLSLRSTKYKNKPLVTQPTTACRQHRASGSSLPQLPLPPQSRDPAVTPQLFSSPRARAAAPGDSPAAGLGPTTHRALNPKGGCSRVWRGNHFRVKGIHHYGPPRPAPRDWGSLPFPSPVAPAGCAGPWRRASDLTSASDSGKQLPGPAGALAQEVEPGGRGQDEPSQHVSSLCH